MVSRRASAAACAADSVGYSFKSPNWDFLRTDFPLMSFSHPVNPYSYTSLSLFEIQTSLLVTRPSKQNSSFV